MWRIFLDESKKAGKKKRKSLFPLVNLTEVVVIMRRTDNTWEHVERITIADSDTRKCRHTNFLSQTLPKHMQYEIQPIQTRPYTPALPYPGLPHNSYTSKLQDKMTCSILYGHLYTHTHTLTHSHTRRHTHAHRHWLLLFPLFVLHWSMDRPKLTFQEGMLWVPEGCTWKSSRI